MTYKKKLIEVALPLPEVNDASAYDKMPGIGPHPKGIHHWWARLPLPTARAVLFASTVDDPSAHPEKWPTEESQDTERERLFDIVRRLMAKKLHEQPAVYEEARAEMLKYCDGALPAVFDPFAGGGSIPLEANRLGFESHAGDLNPVAVLLNKCSLELAPQWLGHSPVNPEDRESLSGKAAWKGNHGLAADVRYYAHAIYDRARSNIGHLYPKVRLAKEQGGAEANVVAWIWAHTVTSPDPAARGKAVPLISTFMLSTKPGKMVWMEPELDQTAADGWRIHVRSHDLSGEKLKTAKLGTKAGKAQPFRCLLTTTPIPRPYVQSEGKAGRLPTRLVAIVADDGKGRRYLSPTEEHEAYGNLNDGSLEEARSGFLAGSLPTRAEITGGVCTAYGLSTWGHLFSSRQLTSLLLLSDLIKDIVADVRRDAIAFGESVDVATNYASSVTTFLALALDRCLDFNNVLCRWSASNEKVMNLFGRQAMPMAFDFAEANILGTSVGSWLTCSGYVADCVEVLATGHTELGYSQQEDAATGVSGLNRMLVSTDPPYYDNISYATLSDFFYVWLRRTVGEIYPTLFGTIFTPKAPELIASPDRFGGRRELAKEHFENGFRRAFSSLRESMDPQFPLTVYYAFKQNDEAGAEDEEAELGSPVDVTTGWETLLEALIGSGFQITATWPVRASQKWRMVSMGTNALASYIVLACRERPKGAPQTDRRSFVAELKRELPVALRHLQQGNIAPVDFAQSAIGPGMAVYSRYSNIVESTGKAMAIRTALSLINQTLTEVLSEVEDEFDTDTRWAIAWFEQEGFGEGEFGDAELLSKAKVTSVAGLQQAGLIYSRGGKVRLLRPEELPKEWDPSTDKRLTVWEMTHQLLRVYYHDKAGDAETAELLRKIGTYGDMARDLAYRLFNLCEKRKRSQEAQAYNALVLGWPEIARLAREGGEPRAQQPGLFERE